MMTWTQADVDQWNALPGFSAQVIHDELVITCENGIRVDIVETFFSSIQGHKVTSHVTLQEDDPGFLEFVERSANRHGLQLISTETPNRYLVEVLS